MRKKEGVGLEQVNAGGMKEGLTGRRESNRKDIALPGEPKLSDQSFVKDWPQVCRGEHVVRKLESFHLPQLDHHSDALFVCAS